jgi:glycosyltransferase involved in cell wall biosynthesis
MKVLVLANNDIGLYKLRKELLERFISEGYDVAISLPHGNMIPDLQALGCRYILTEFNRRGKNPIKDLKLLGQYKVILKKEKPDIVLTYTIKPNVYGGMACAETGTPYIANVTGLGTAIENPGVLQKVTLGLYKVGLKKAKCVFFQNQDNKEYFFQKGIVRNRADLIPGSGVNLNEHRFEEYPEEHGGLRFLFIGRIMKDKGVQELFDAARGIKKRDPTCSFRIIGECDEDFSEQIASYERDGVIEWLGFQKDVHSYISDSHCTILPSYHEGTANVLLESAASGRPVIATRVTGCKETFDEGITGIGCSPRDSQDLIRAINDFIALTPERRAEMGLAGRKKMENEFDRASVIQKYIAEIGR